MATTINITNSGSGAYSINGSNNAEIVLTRGNTYYLQIDANGHPFWIQTVPGAYNPGYYGNNIYSSSGLTNNGTQSGTITFLVPNDAPDFLYYACQYHSSMQGTIRILNPENRSNPTLTNFTISNQTYSNEGTFTFNAPSTNSTGAFSYTSSNTSIATVNGNTVTMIQVGSVAITATQAETATYNSGIIQTSFSITKANPTFGTFSNLTKNLNTNNFTITPPISNSTGVFSYTSSNTTIATINGNTVTMLAVGTVTITATQAETTNYNSGTTTTTLTINNKTDPTLTNFTISNQTYSNGGTFTFNAPSTNSAGAFSYTSSNTSIATVNGNTVTMIQVGSVAITATQAETATYNSGSIQTSFSITKATPTFGTFSIQPKTFINGGTFTITPPSSSSNGAFSYTSSNTSIATINGNIVTMLAVGTVTITATQAATTNYNSGTTTTTLTINSKASPTLTNFTISNQTYSIGGTFTITPPSTNSDGAFSYTSSNTSIATVNGYIVSIVTAGSVIITATQAETTNYNSGSITATLTINRADPVLTNFFIPNQTFLNGGTFTITPPSTNSTGPLSYTTINPNIVSLISSSTTVTMIKAGIVTITAIQQPTINYNSSSISSTFTILQSYFAISNTEWYQYAATSNRLRQTYITGFLDVSGGNMIVRGGNFNIDGIIQQNTDQNYPNISYVNYSLSDLDLRYLRIENPSFSPTTNFNFQNDVSMNTKLSVVGDVSFGSRLLLGGDASLNSRLFVSGDVSLNSRLFVGGDVSMNSRLFVRTDLSVNRFLSVGDDVSLNDRLFVRNDVSLNMNLQVAKNVAIGTPISSYGLDVSGALRLNTTNDFENKIAVLYDSTPSESFITGTSFYGFGVNSGILRYQTPLAGNVHNFYAGSGFGGINALSYNVASDYRIKTDVVEVASRPDLSIDKLRPVFYYNTDAQKHDIGFLAHEVQAEFPFLVNGEKDDEEKQTLNYIGMIGILVNEIQSLKAQVAKLSKKMD